MEQREALFAEMRAKFHEAARGLFGDTVRTYVYDGQGRIAERHMRMGPMREDLTFSYNERGDINELRMEQSGSLDGSIPLTPITLEVRREYEYDSFGNWTRMMETSGFSGNVSLHTPTRQLTYHL
jgi:hypothetical protein